MKKEGSPISTLLPAVVSGFLAMPTGNIADALFELGFAPCSIPGPKALAPGQRRFAGPAFTVQQRPKSNAAGPGRTRHLEAIDALAAPGDVVVIDVAGRTDVCTLGGLLARRAKIRGLAGFLVNGCVRDAADIEETAFPVHCLGTAPRKSTVELETASIAEPVVIGGCPIVPGDLIVCDDTGAVMVPAHAAEQVLARAEEIAQREDVVASRVDQGVSLKEAFAALGRTGA
jgi:4-hydroxy-4-methyl-2-oxoglutarate aldolase